MSFLTFICGVRYIGTLGGGVLFISSDGNDRMAAKIKTPKKLLDQELTPQKSHAEFPSLRKFGCTLFAEQRSWDTRAMPRIFRLLTQANLQENPSKIPVT